MHICTSLLFSGLLSTSSAFTTGPRRPVVVQQRHLTTTLNVGYALDWNTDDEMFLMQKAQTCADSDSCTLDDAKAYLDDMIHIQSGCASGVLLGSDVCNNVDTAAEVVATLREKIDRESKRVRIFSASSNVVTVSLAIMVLSSFVAGMVAVNPDVTPFTPQEWYWAIRDGYLPTMIEYYFRNGGLATVDYETETTPFALQEWWWAIKGGYLNTMAEHYMRNGGLATPADYQLEAAAITPQEWLWAARDGYLPTTLEQNFQNGGLATVDYESDVLPLTPQEWMWAAKDGYLPAMVEHYFRNGGL